MCMGRELGFGLGAGGGGGGDAGVEGAGSSRVKRRRGIDCDDFGGKIYFSSS